MAEFIARVELGRIPHRELQKWMRYPELIRCRECRYWEGSKAYGGHWCSLMGPGCGPEFYCGRGERKRPEEEAER